MLAESITESVAGLPRLLLGRLAVGFRQRPLQSRWASAEWTLAGVALPEDEASLRTQAEMIHPDQPLELHPSEGEGYWLNLQSPNPCVFVMWRTDEGDGRPYPALVTLSYNEAARMLDAGERVEHVPMPEILAQALAEYVHAHYRPEPRRKVRRNDPFRADGARGEKP